LFLFRGGGMTHPYPEPDLIGDCGCPYVDPNDPYEMQWQYELLLAETGGYPNDVIDLEVTHD
jgi:hypothetical protein